ncbi:manganese-dependent ADP-ribose/CDP-alcohol diphosphatase-like isoform X2 [Acanthaster planci]|nr:manganese-dependent ADP-ribose/CDP-alcohol diphosphatase-like isoform X2 [Acanthaster planci]XP_022110178.1 manganese-dependent ADP-ribose/CDP-alcohol diphosphatase-like isoform X2 [Acanthaster planci]
MENKASACVFSFGVISDIQHADIENRLNYSQTCMRYYRNALALLKEAVDHWMDGDTSAIRPDFVVQLGDVLDGFNSEGGKDESLRILDVILNQFDRLPCTVHHLFGNHEFYNFSRVELMNSRLFSGAKFETTARDSECECFPEDSLSAGKSRAGGLATYYHFSPAPGFRVVILDSYSRSIIGHNDMCPIGQESLRLVRSVNKNEILNSPLGLKVSEKRFVAFNGGLGEKQMAWLENVLEGACLAKEKVILFGHIPIYPIHRDHTCLLWDYQEALKLVRSSPCVVALFTGHTHSYAYTVDEMSGIHFLNFPGVVEIPPGGNGFGTIAVYGDRLVLHGVGHVDDVVMKFPEQSMYQD